MKKLLTSPVQMNLTDTQNQYYQQVLKYVAELSLNFMAVKVVTYPENFLDWCQEFHRICQEDLNLALLDDHQFKPLKKLEETLVQAISVSQIKLSRVMPWPIFNAFIEQNATRHALQERLGLLAYLKRKLETPYSEWIEEDRLAFIGKHTAKHDPSVYTFDVEWFGSTKSAKNFHQLLQNNPELLDKALANIPAEGDVSEQDYQNFVVDYLSAHNVLDDVKPTLAPATRLLAMHRPDVFLPLTNSKLDSLCAAFEVPKLNNKDFDRYYKDIIQAMHVMPWYRSKCPETELEQQLWSVRALLPTLFYYVDENTASNSNYLKLLNKPKRVTKIGTTRTKRGKESAEILVDRALEADDIAEHIKSKRDSIIAEVVKGRTVAETISLMRMIFG